jgi:hypothetical protein
MDFPYILTELFSIEVNNMDLFWSGLARRASKHTRIERKSQFRGVHETAIKAIKKKKV